MEFVIRKKERKDCRDVAHVVTVAWNETYKGIVPDWFLEELKVKLVGIDSWDRPVYKDKSGNLYKDVNLGRGELDLHTAVNNDFYGEPDSPISDDIKVSVIKSFNKNKDRER